MDRLLRSDGKRTGAARGKFSPVYRTRPRRLSPPRCRHSSGADEPVPLGVVGAGGTEKTKGPTTRRLFVNTVYLEPLYRARGPPRSRDRGREDAGRETDVGRCPPSRHGPDGTAGTATAFSFRSRGPTEPC